jgi:flavin reductase (DIM6/NTAB) family NADH-FMN oxidoreductase RutF
MKQANGERVKKDTLKNIEETNEWVFNVLTTNYLPEANDCSASLPEDQDETKEYGLQTLPSRFVKPPRLADAKVSLECKFWDKKEVYNDDGEHTTTIVMGRVVHIHVHSSVLKQKVAPDGSTSPLVDLTKLQAVGRAGDITYWPVGISNPDSDALSMPRPK